MLLVVSVTLPVVVGMTFYGIACSVCHCIVLVLCLDCLFQRDSDALFYFVFIVEESL
jgi:hypothetical protein